MELELFSLLIKNKKSITAKYLSSELEVKISKKRNLVLKNFIQIKVKKILTIYFYPVFKSKVILIYR